LQLWSQIGAATTDFPTNRGLEKGRSNGSESRSKISFNNIIRFCSDRELREELRARGYDESRAPLHAMIQLSARAEARHPPIRANEYFFFRKAPDDFI
jgi:hypothetical protein